MEHFSSDVICVEHTGNYESTDFKIKFPIVHKVERCSFNCFYCLPILSSCCISSSKKDKFNDIDNTIDTESQLRLEDKFINVNVYNNNILCSNVNAIVDSNGNF